MKAPREEMNSPSIIYIIRIIRILLFFAATYSLCMCSIWLSARLIDQCRKSSALLTTGVGLRKVDWHACRHAQ